MAKGKGGAKVAPLCVDDSGMQSLNSESDSRDACAADTLPRNFVVGYALTEKKRKSFIQNRLLTETKRKGIQLLEILQSEPLVKQGPFDAILHKLPGKRWQLELEEYSKKFPEVVIIDRPNAIQRLRSRQSMLNAVELVDLSHCGGKVGIPQQLVIESDTSSIPDLVTNAGLRFPLVVKPLLNDGTDKSHALSLAHDVRCYPYLAPPIVLQEFVNHGGVLFKAYVVGENVRVVKRLSLPDVKEGELRPNGLISFPRISSSHVAQTPLALDKLGSQEAEPPPQDLLRYLASELRQKLGLNLFNMDIIREGGGTGERYYVIDINYFPGYSKMPGYEVFFVEFLLQLARERLLPPQSTNGTSTSSRPARSSSPTPSPNIADDVLRESS
eukprot:TRINITY_DN18836_c0_g1_i1.p1 TRINITY_DN18836_c0_g1~~TRINITY_DN18836_c0_g1_i1.p1  ORF type:complete len:385 (-),score=45.03 TRINITY_DN18836_c0_g1_i1:1149-2303(-)